MRTSGKGSWAGIVRRGAVAAAAAAMLTAGCSGGGDSAAPGASSADSAATSSNGTTETPPTGPISARLLTVADLPAGSKANTSLTVEQATAGVKQGLELAKDAKVTPAECLDGQQTSAAAFDEFVKGGAVFMASLGADPTAAIVEFIVPRTVDVAKTTASLSGPCSDVTVEITQFGQTVKARTRAEKLPLPAGIRGDAVFVKTSVTVGVGQPLVTYAGHANVGGTTIVVSVVGDGQEKQAGQLFERAAEKARTGS